MQHVEYTLLMSLVLDGEANGDERARLREHLQSCDSCALAWQRWQELDRRLARAPILPAPANLAASVAVRLDARQSGLAQRRWFMLGLALSWIAVVVVALLSLAMANGWQLQLPPIQGPIAAALSGLASIGSWLWRETLGFLTRAGAPLVAAAAGGLLCLTCGLAMGWLWIVARLTTSAQGAMAPFE